MSKKKTSTDDFLRLLDDEENSPQVMAFSPTHQTADALRADKKLSQPASEIQIIMSQSGVKVGPIMSQSAAKPKPSLEVKKSSLAESRAKVEPQPEPLHEPIMSQSGVKVEPNTDLSSLVGLQKNVLNYIFESCLSAGNKISSAVAVSNISISMESTVAAVRKAIQRLEQKGFIVRNQFKDGRGGWTKYELPQAVYSEMLSNRSRAKVEPIMSQSGVKVRTKVEPQPEPSVPCSSSIINSLLENKNTTTEDSDFWLSVPQNLQGLVNVKQLREFVKQGLVSAEELQSSIDGFSFDLEKGMVKAKNGNPVAILIGAIKSGGYISQQYVAELKASLAEVEKSRAELKQIQANQLIELFAAEFEEFRKANPEKAESLKPVSGFITSFVPGSAGYSLWLEEFKKSKQADHESEQAPHVETHDAKRL